MTHLINFITWWYKNVPLFLLILTKRALVFTDNQTAFTVFSKNLFIPLFGDPSIVGRGVALVYRIARAVLGGLALLIVLISFLILNLLWLLLPILLIINSKFFGVLILLGSFVIWLSRKVTSPKYALSDYKEGTDVFDLLTIEAKNIISSIKNKDINIQIKKDKAINALLIRVGIKDTNHFFESLNLSEIAEISTEVLLARAFEMARESGSKFIESPHIFFGLLTLLPKIESNLFKLDLTLADFKETITWIEEIRKVKSGKFIWNKDYEIKPMGGVNRDWTGRVTPVLNKYSSDLTESAGLGKLPKVIGKEKQISQIVRILSRSDKRNVLVIGEPGSGKTTLVGGLANEIIEGTKHPTLKFKRLASLDVGSLTAGSSNFGELNNRLKDLISEIKGSGNIILFADEVHNLATVLSDDPSASTIFSVFEPHLDKAEFQFIGATNVSNYKRYIEPNGAFARLFEVVNLPEATKDQTLKILKNVAVEYEFKYKLIFSYPALKKAVELSGRLIHDRVLPDKAVDICEEAATLVLESARKTVFEEDVIKIISTKTSVPVTKASEFESKILINLEDEIHKKIIDQDEAVVAVSKALRRARVGIRDESRPIASFLFVGPTGVGKTETSKALAEIYFGGVSSMVRLDMSEYQTKDSIRKMIGPPPGQPGAFLGGQLTESIKRNPFSLVLIDELEKAHTDIILLFLQVMDDGRLTDSMGKTVNFSDTILIATSNVGTKKIQEASVEGQNFEKIKEISLNELQDRFPPEFLNRFSGIITFKPLSPEDTVEITKLQMKNLEKRLYNQGIKIEYEDEFIHRLSALGYDPKWGARPLRRLIEDKIESTLAKEILEGKLKKGDSKKLELSYLKG